MATFLPICPTHTRERFAILPCINLLNVYSHMRPEITDPQQLADDAEEWLHNVIAYRKRHEAGN